MKTTFELDLEHFSKLFNIEYPKTLNIMTDNSNLFLSCRYLMIDEVKQKSEVIATSEEVYNDI